MDRRYDATDRILAEFLARLPGRFTDLLGIRVEQAGTDRTVTMECRRELTMPYGVIHGGAVAALADSAAGIAMTATCGRRSLRDGRDEAEPARGGPRGDLTAEASLIHRGRRTAVYEVRVTDGQARLIALFLCTQMILEQQRPPQNGRCQPPGLPNPSQPEGLAGRGVPLVAWDPAVRSESGSAARSLRTGYGSPGGTALKCPGQMSTSGHAAASGGP